MVVCWNPATCCSCSTTAKLPGRCCGSHSNRSHNLSIPRPTTDGQLRTTPARQLTLISEGGRQPQIIIVDAKGQPQIRIPVATQTKNPKAQISFARAAAPRRVPVTLPADRQIREYDLEGRVRWKWTAPHPPANAVRLPNGHPCQPTRRSIGRSQCRRKNRLANDPEDFDKPYLNGLSNFRILANGNSSLPPPIPKPRSAA